MNQPKPQSARGGCHCPWQACNS